MHTHYADMSKSRVVCLIDPDILDVKFHQTYSFTHSHMYTIHNTLVVH